MLVNNTPIEVYSVHGQHRYVDIHVKREDLCSPYPGPAFSKIRGVVAHIKNRPEQLIGVLDTAHSKAGWAVSYVCRHLGRQCVNYWPREGSTLRRFQQEAELNGARLVELKAGRSSVLYHQARKLLDADSHGTGYLMPNALKLPESVTENAEEARRTLKNPLMPNHGTVILSVSSGTVAAGVMLGLRDTPGLKFLLHMGYSRSLEATTAYIEKTAPGMPWDRVSYIDEGYTYADSARFSFIPCPFPTNPFYDGKAWRWLVAGLGEAKNPMHAGRPALEVLAEQGPIVFWNIGE